MVLPVFKHSHVTIVNHKQRKHRKSDAPLWQRMFLDVAVLGMAHGIEAIVEEWAGPINDTLHTSIFGVGTVDIEEAVNKTLEHLE